MKKEYINPEMEVVKIQISQHLMEGSPVDTLDNNPDNAVTPGEEDAAFFFGDGDDEDW